MKFEKDGMKWEVSNLSHVVINSVIRTIKLAKGGKSAHVTNEKERIEEKGTRVWYRMNFAKGTRWAKFRYHGEIPEVPEILADAELFESPAGIQMMITDAMSRPDIRVWFSGTYVNIEICENWQEVQRIRAQEAKRRSRARAAKILKSPNLQMILRDAISSAGAQVRQESISTPFGNFPVMTISHRR